MSDPIETTGAPSRMLGAVASPRHLLAAAVPFVAVTYPPNFVRIPAKLSYWGNDWYGSCVSTEEAWAKDCDGLWVTESDLISWASKYGYLNGANLTEVMDTMFDAGLPSDNKVYTDGHYNSVDWEDYPTLCSAIFQGPVKIGVAHGQIQDASGNSNGWWLTKASKNCNIDHCVGLGGYGTAAWLADQFKVSVPSGVDPNTPCVAMFTWNTIGIVTHSALIAVTGEAWLRNPTTPGVSPPNPSPEPGPIPCPGPPPLDPPVPVPGPTPTPTTVSVGPVDLQARRYDVILRDGFAHRVNAGAVAIPAAGAWIINFQK